MPSLPPVVKLVKQPHRPRMKQAVNALQRLRALSEPYFLQQFGVEIFPGPMQSQVDAIIGQLQRLLATVVFKSDPHP